MEEFNLINEVWKSIDGFEGLYEISNFGRVRSLPRNTTKGKILKQKEIIDGHLNVCLSKNNKKYYCAVHRLVAAAFIPNPNNYPCVNHKDENPKNNYANNLEWCTIKYNTNYGSALKKRSLKRLKQVICVESNEVFNSSEEAVKKYNLSKNQKVHILECCRGKRKTCCGLHWKFAN